MPKHAEVNTCHKSYLNACVVGYINYNVVSVCSIDVVFRRRPMKTADSRSRFCEVKVSVSLRTP